MAMELPTIPLGQLNKRPQSLAELMQPFLANQQTSQNMAHNAAMNPFIEHLKGVESQYAQQNAEAKLKDLLAHTGYLGAETSAIPQRLGIQQGQLDVSRGNLSARQKELGFQSDPANQFIKTLSQLPGNQKVAYLTSSKGALDTIVNHMDDLSRKAGSPGMNAEEREGAKQSILLDAKNQENKEITKDPEAWKQLDSSIAYRQYMQNPKVLQGARDAAEYAGAAGRGKEALDAWMKNPKNEQTYRNAQFFKDFMLQDQANFTRQIEGLRATNVQNKKLNDMYNSALKNWSSNPARAMEYYWDAQNELASIEKARSQAAQKKHPWVNENMIKPGSGEGFYDVPDFRKMASSSKSSFPAFKDKQEEKSWFLKATPQQQEEYLSHRTKNG